MFPRGLKGEQVVAIDISMKELNEASAGFLKILMDASDLKFPDKSFRTVTAFFALLYRGVPNPPLASRRQDPVRLGEDLRMDLRRHEPWPDRIPARSAAVVPDA